MDLKLTEVAELLNVSEQTVERWVDSSLIPCYQFQGQTRFNRLEIEDWVMNASQGGQRFFEMGAWNQFGLYRAIHKGNVIQDVDFTTKDEFIHLVMQKISVQLSLDTDVVSELLIDREKLMSTGLGHGIAVPHTRDFLLKGLFDAVIVVFPKTPVEWGSLDNQPVHSFFFLFSCDGRRHLNLLAKIAHLASNPQALEFLKTKPHRQDLLPYVKNWESSVGASLCSV